MDVREVALGSATDFSGHDGDHAAWHRRVRRWVAPALALSYQHTDPRLLPAAAPCRVPAMHEGLGVVEAVLGQRDGKRMVVKLERRHTDRHWVVVSAEAVQVDRNDVVA